MKFISLFSLSVGLWVTSAWAQSTPTTTLPTTTSGPTVTVLDNTASAVNTTDATNIHIYGGYAGDVGGCAGSLDNANVCNSCTALNLSGGVVNCASRSIYPNLVLTIQMTLAQLPTTPHLQVQWGDSGGTAVTTIDTPTQFTAGQPFTVKVRWGDLCSHANLAGCTGGSTTSAGANGTLLVGLTDGGTTFASGNYQRFTVHISFVNSSDTTTLVPNPTDSPGPQYGFSYFNVLPGDGKVYVRNLKRGSVEPAGNNSGGAAVKWDAVRVYYSEYTGTPDFRNITLNGSNFVDLKVLDKVNLDSPLSDGKVTGLTNDSHYMFNIATVDEATVVAGFLDPNGMAGSADKDKFVAQPGEVVGLLDDKKCFIATAAFGSQMAPQVELLRQFRNQFLIPNSWGRKFVHFYYKYSPPAAEFISQHDSLRAVIRGMLWPLILFADLSMKIGVFLTFGLFALALGSLILVARRFGRTV